MKYDTIPFPITDDIRDAFEAHRDYVSAGQKWLLKNDPDCANEQALLEDLETAIYQSAESVMSEDDYDNFTEWHSNLHNQQEIYFMLEELFVA